MAAESEASSGLVAIHRTGADSNASGALRNSGSVTRTITTNPPVLQGSAVFLGSAGFYRVLQGSTRFVRRKVLRGSFVRGANPAEPSRTRPNPVEPTRMSQTL